MKQKIRLLAEKELLWSPIVANNRMNRERQASGVNSYENEIGFRPENWLLDKLQQQETVKWLDVCCGQGNALIQVAQFFADTNTPSRVELTGIDLVDFFSPIPPAITNLELVSIPVLEWYKKQPIQQFDLITCIHGLHYIGNKLLVVNQLINSLTPTGLFIANFDIASIFVNNVANPLLLKNWFKRHHIQYDSSKKLIQAKGLNKPFPVCPTIYLGADDQAGKNYTGQEAVNSYYEQLA